MRPTSHWTVRVGRRFRALIRRHEFEREMDDEMRFHIEMEAADLVQRGVRPEAANRQARLAFGGVERFKEAGRDVRGVRWLDVMRQDLHYAARVLRTSPGFTAAAALCIALGVCVTTTIFSAVDAILIRPLPYPNADRLVAVYAQNTVRGYHGTNISYPDYVSWRDGTHTFTALGMWTWTSHALSGEGGEGEAERVEGAAVTANLFPLLGVRPLLGRSFAASEERPGQDREILLSYGLWQRRFAGARSVIGRTITVDGLPYTVVGVMPPHFNFPDRGQAWVPLAVDLRHSTRENRFYAGAIGRLNAGVTLEQARADLAAVSERLQRDFPKENYGWAAEPITLRQDLTGDLRTPLLVFLGAVGFVLLIACANVANLLLARGASRERELAIRAAVGAGRGRLVRQLLTESLVLAMLGGVLGTVLAVFGVRLLRLAFPNDVPFYISLGLDGRALVFAMALSALTGALVGALPASRGAMVDLNTSLRAGGHGAGDRRARGRLRDTLVVAEVALSLVLMIGAMLLIRSYRALEGTDLGFDEQGILSMRVSLPEVTYKEPARRVVFYQQLLTRIAALPGVQAVGSAQGIPFSGWNVQGSMSVAGHPAAKPGEELISHFQWISPTYFQAIGVPLLRGRGFTAADRDSAAPVGIINETLARRVFPNEDPLGARVKIGDPDGPDPWVTVVGIARDYRHYRLPQPMGPAIYLPYATSPTLTQTLAIRTRLADPVVLAPAVRAVIRELDPEVPLYQVQTFAQVVSSSLWRQRLQGQVLGLFAVLALLLASIGLYGVISYAVAQRTRELGVRMALGATRRRVLTLVLRRGARLALAGVVIGLAGAFVLTRVVASLLYGVRATDPVTFAVVPGVLTVVALVASYVPARRAARLDPVVAMRAD